MPGFWPSSVQLARLGNPAALAQLTGVSEITSLYRDYALISSDIFQMKAAVDPQNFSVNGGRHPLGSAD
jgi:hypothetical protein